MYWNTVYPRSDTSCNKICDISVENSIVDSCFYFTLKNIDDNAHRIRFYHTFSCSLRNRLTGQAIGIVLNVCIFLSLAHQKNKSIYST